MNKPCFRHRPRLQIHFNKQSNRTPPYTTEQYPVAVANEIRGQTRLPEQHVVPGGRVVFISLSAALASACCVAPLLIPTNPPIATSYLVRYTSSPFATRRRDKSNITRTGVNTQNVYLQLETSVPITAGVMLTLM